MSSVMSRLDPVTPGDLLLEEFLKPIGISQYRLAGETGTPKISQDLAIAQQGVAGSMNSGSGKDSSVASDGGIQAIRPI